MREFRLAVSIALASALIAVLSASARAGPPMTSGVASTNNTVLRSVTNDGGNAATSGSLSSNNSLIGSVGEEVMVTTMTSGTGGTNNKVRAGWSELQSFPGTATGLTAALDNTVSSATLNWSAPGYDGTLGTLQPGTAYLIRVASYTAPDTFGSSVYANYSVSTSAVAPGWGVGAGATGLIPNTTYFAQLWTKDADANLSYASPRATFTTLASSPTLLGGFSQFLFIQRSSASVAWAALPASPLAATCEGYVLRASSDGFLVGGTAPVFSSTTYSYLASTLTVGSPAVPLDLANTYYFQVGSLNHTGQANYASLGKLNFQIQPSISLLQLGGLDPSVAMSTVSTSSMVVTNVGNWPATIELSANFPSSPWTLFTGPGVDTAALMGVWNAGTPGPSPSVFTTYISSSPRASQTAGNYSGGTQNAFQILPGQNRTLWFRFFMPTSTSSLGPETLQVIAQGVYP